MLWSWHITFLFLFLIFDCKLRLDIIFKWFFIFDIFNNLYENTLLIFCLNHSLNCCRWMSFQSWIFIKEILNKICLCFFRHLIIDTSLKVFFIICFVICQSYRIEDFRIVRINEVIWIDWLYWNLNNLLFHLILLTYV
jgi:hypothetical protein